MYVLMVCLLIMYKNELGVGVQGVNVILISQYECPWPAQ